MPRYGNTTNGPVVYDVEGHLFGGSEWIETEETELLLRAISFGWVIELPPLEEPVQEQSKPRRRRNKKVEETEDKTEENASE